MENFYNTKQSRIRKLVPCSCRQKPYIQSAMLVLSPSFFIDLTLQPKSKVEFRTLMCLYHFYGTNCEVKIKKLLRNLKYYNLISGGQKIKELLELCLELGSLKKAYKPLQILNVVDKLAESAGEPRGGRLHHASCLRRPPKL